MNLNVPRKLFVSSTSLVGFMRIDRFFGRLTNTLVANSILKANFSLSSTRMDVVDSLGGGTRIISTAGSNAGPFNPKKALILTKFSRYEFEKRRHPEWNESDLIENLKRRGSDYKNLKHHHNINSNCREMVLSVLNKHGIETKIVNRFDYTFEAINWADVIFTVGGDGTFLMAASKVISSDKPLIGINSDPTRSVGHLCLSSKYTENFKLALDALFSGQFSWTFRQRIRVTLKGENAFDDPIELHNQQLLRPEYRYLDLEQYNWNERVDIRESNQDGSKVHVLPVRALNEVFVGESLSSRVSYYEFSTNNEPPVKLKSSGLTICTGTGSTSWSFNINKVTNQCVGSLFKLIGEETGHILPDDKDAIERITRRFNSSLIFEPNRTVMAYTIRDPVVFGTKFTNDWNPRGFVNNLHVRSRMLDACIVIDGGLSYQFNDGASAVFEIDEKDALRTVMLE